MPKINTESFESFAYPSWWLNANAVVVAFADGRADLQLSRPDVQFLPQGLAYLLGSGLGGFTPWAGIKSIGQV
jgi:hypothetical protein